MIGLSHGGLLQDQGTESQRRRFRSRSRRTMSASLTTPAYANSPLDSDTAVAQDSPSSHEVQ